MKQTTDIHLCASKVMEPARRWRDAEETLGMLAEPHGQSHGAHTVGVSPMETLAAARDTCLKPS
jgi:hypothetical protein